MREDEKFRKAKEAEQRGKKHNFTPKPTAEFKPRCWICNQDGLRQQEFFARFLIEQKKFELTRGRHHNMFDPQEVQQAKGALQGERCLWYIRWAGDNTKIRIPKRCFDTVKMAEQMFGEGIMLACTECVKERGFKTMTDEKHEELDWDKLMAHAAVYDVFVDPVVTAQATQELQASN